MIKHNINNLLWGHSRITGSGCTQMIVSLIQQLHLEHIKEWTILETVTLGILLFLIIIWWLLITESRIWGKAFDSFCITNTNPEKYYRYFMCPISGWSIHLKPSNELEILWGNYSTKWLTRSIWNTEPLTFEPQGHL
jgi:hypothetical protein